MGIKKPYRVGVTHPWHHVHRFELWECLSSALSESGSEEKINQKRSPCGEEEEGGERECGDTRGL